MDRNKRKLKGYFTTGEFAKLCNVKKQTLFHYDDIGILKPEIRGKNGYRYYSYLQLDTFFTISMLKDLDMPLAEIKKYLNSRSPENFLSLLGGYSAILDEKILELQWLKAFIRERKKITLEGMNAVHGEIMIEDRDTEYYMITKYLGSSSDRDIYTAIADHLNFCQEMQIYSTYGIGALIKADSGFTDDDYTYSHLFTRLNPLDIDSSSRITTIKPQKYAVIYSRKGYDDIPQMLKRLTDFVSDRGYEAGGYFFEDTLLDDMSKFSIDEYTVKLSLPLAAPVTTDET